MVVDNPEAQLPVEEAPVQESAPGEEAQPVQEAKPAEQATPPVEAVAPHEPFDLVAMLVTEINALKSRVAALEGMAHSEHTITADGVKEIASAAVNQINEQLKARMSNPVV